ncbi:MAG TPA: NAD-dependent epimerase/dehydratase family protein [Polyangiaceae bacterium LLY-WYZ-14_1]|nr:NAD-dependent epimerase/dehydratase family protein [Polyangiaceae bacterium LLY-WYZ-14_1]
MEAVLRTLVTGGAGFIGSHLCARLLELGHEVFALDNLATGDARNLEPFEGHPRFHFRLHDVTVHFDVGPIDRVYHLAGAAPGHRDPHHGVDIVIDAVVGTQHALRLARQYEARLLLASSRAVYGDPTAAPQHEGGCGALPPEDPRAAHADGKRAAETLVTQFAQAFGVDARVARIFDTYGPGMGIDEAHPVATLAEQALRGGPMVLPHLHPDERRSFCHVSDLVHGLIALMEGPPGVEPVNLGHPDPVSFAELAAAIAGAAGVDRAALVPPAGLARTETTVVHCPALERAVTRLGFAPTVSLGEGLPGVIQDLLARRETALARSA